MTQRSPFCRKFKTLEVSFSRTYIDGFHRHAHFFLIRILPLFIDVWVSSKNYFFKLHFLEPALFVFAYQMSTCVYILSACKLN